jgi:hypothetical protein
MLVLSGVFLNTRILDATNYTNQDYMRVNYTLIVFYTMLLVTGPKQKTSHVFAWIWPNSDRWLVNHCAMPSIGQTWVLASIGAVVEMGVLSTLKLGLISNCPGPFWLDNPWIPPPPMNPHMANLFYTIQNALSRALDNFSTWGVCRIQCARARCIWLAFIDFGDWQILNTFKVIRYIKDIWSRILA